MITFIKQYLDPVDRLGEILFGLIMALGFTGACRLGLEEPDNRELFIGISGCNLAWAIVDGVMYVLMVLFERGRRARMFRMVAKAPTDAEALRRIDHELKDRLELLTTEEERGKIYRWIMEVIRRGSHEKARIRLEDVLGGVAAGLLIVIATIPVVLPFLIFGEPTMAVRVSNLVAFALLFWLGWWWGREVGSNPWRIGVGLTLIGVVLVLITIALGG